MSFRHFGFSVIGADVAVDIQHGHRLAVGGRVAGREAGEEHVGFALAGEAFEATPQRLGFRCPAQAQQPADVDRIAAVRPSARGSPNNAANTTVNTSERSP